jgi:hypothetical protein
MYDTGSEKDQRCVDVESLERVEKVRNARNPSDDGYFGYGMLTTD